MIIDSLYQGVIAKLTQQGKIAAISQELLSMNENWERVLYVSKLIDSLKLFPRVTEVRKDINVSAHYRNLGNNCFQKAEDFKAWQYYNLSLLYAPLDSENFALALANRSAVFFSMDKYNECINDVDRVLTMNCPEKIKDKLIKRKEESLSFSVKKISVSSSTESCIDLKLKEFNGPRFPCASPKLEVVFTKEMGRHVVAKSDINVGEVLVQEEPYFKLLLVSQYLYSCAYCLSRNMNLLPCPNCCFVLYCSDECKEKAYKEYHSVECPLMATIIEMDFTKLEFLALRTAIKARTDHSDWSALFKCIEDTESNKDSEYRGHVKINEYWIYDSKYYASIHTLASNVEKRSVSDIFQKCITAAVFTKMLKENTDFMNANDEKQEENIIKCVAGMLLLHIMTSPTNMHGLNAIIQNAQGLYLEDLSLASGAYAFLSLINHSCAPNVVRFSKLGSGQVSLLALRPIKKGQQIFDNYGSHHALEDRISRYRSLKSQYKFECCCEACTNNWPTYMCMGPAIGSPTQLRVLKEKVLNSNTMQKLKEGDLATVEKIFKLLCQLAQKFEPYIPCTELADCQESLKQCLQILGGLVPYGYTQQVAWSVKSPIE